MTRDELKDALDGLFAYDDGALSSGIHDERLRRRCIDQMDSMDQQDLARLVAEMWFNEAAYEQGYGFEDAYGFVRWLGEHMEQA